MKKIIFIAIICLINYSQILYSQNRLESHHHQFLLKEAWLLVREKHPEVIGSIMDLNIGNWEDPNILDKDFVYGKLVTGAYREDEKDVVYGYGGWNTTATHFWDPEDITCDNNPYNSKFKPWDYCFENSYVKAQSYLSGKKWGSQDILLIVPVSILSGPGVPGPGEYKLGLTYDDLIYTYQNSEMYAHFLFTNSEPPLPITSYNPPILFSSSFQLIGTDPLTKINYIIMEIIGRMCHLLGDAGVPAHVHNDVHSYDSYENGWMPAHYMETSHSDALNQGGIFEDIYEKRNPLRYLFYITDQIADRFNSAREYGNNFYYLPLISFSIISVRLLRTMPEK